MFTGIIEEVGRVVSFRSGRFTIAARAVLRDVEPGASMAVNGACLTVTEFDNASFTVDIMSETLERTNLGLLKAGSEVNLERPLAFGGRLGGHLVQGHVDDTGRVVSVTPDVARMIRCEASPKVMGYIVEKGFIAVDGVSLTVVDYDSKSFWVSVVGYTQTHTTLGSRRTGDLVNLEVDIIAKYVERLSGTSREGITVDFLREHGFMAA